MVPVVLIASLIAAAVMNKISIIIYVQITFISNLSLMRKPELIIIKPII